MAYYKVSVDVSDLFDDMLVQAQKSFLIDKFCSLATDQQIEVVSEMLENLNGGKDSLNFEEALKAIMKATGAKMNKKEEENKNKEGED